MIIALSVYDNAVDTRMPAFKHADDVCKSIWQLLSIVRRVHVFCLQARPGHMIPFMGLQAFDLCATALFVFALFSYLPYLKNWLLSLVSFIYMKIYT